MTLFANPSQPRAADSLGFWLRVKHVKHYFDSWEKRESRDRDAVLEGIQKIPHILHTRAEPHLDQGFHREGSSTSFSLGVHGANVDALLHSRAGRATLLHD
jgi:hypothetical protein